LTENIPAVAGGFVIRAATPLDARAYVERL
jgi:hypothetical protein